MTKPWEQNLTVDTAKPPWEQDLITEDTRKPWEQGLAVADTEEVEAGAYSTEVPLYENISTDTDWLKASEVVYNMGKNEETKWIGTDEELADWSINHMTWFEANLTVGMGVDAIRLQSASQEQKEAFLYLMETYPQIDEPNLPAFGRFAARAAIDPLNLVGLGTLGMGFIGKQAVKATTRQGLLELLKQGVKRSAPIGMAEGYLYGAGTEAVKEGIRVSAGAQDEMDFGRINKQGGVGAVAGLVLAPALDVGFTSVANKVARNAAQKKQTVAKKEVGELNQEPTLDVDALAREADGVVETPQVQEVDGMLIDIPFFNTALKSPLRHGETMVDRAQGLIEVIKEITPQRFAKVAEQIRRSGLDRETESNVDLAVQAVRSHYLDEKASLITRWEEATDIPAQERLWDEIQEAEVHLSQVSALDEDLAGAAGMALKQRDLNEFHSGKGFTLKELKERNPDISEEELILKQRDFIVHGEVKNRIKRLELKLEREGQEALDRKDAATWLRLRRETREQVDKIISEEGLKPKWNTWSAAKKRLYDMTVPVLEVAYSNVFSATTLMINVGFSSLKTMYRPASDFLLGGRYDKQARLQAMAGYAGFRAMRNSAWQTAKATFKYEKQVATFETNKMFDENIKIKGRFGAVLRTIPRLLIASDAFLQDMNYRGFVSAQATGEAFEEGLKKGLTGEALDKYVKKQVKKRVDAAYDVTMRKETVDAVYRKGIAKGLKEGDEIDSWVAKQLEKDESGLFSYNDQGALDYSNDILFKRPFEGKTFLSGQAGNYEKFLREWPVAKLALNLFWRTPIRVFEEGVRLTPALNMGSKRFRDDLYGNNGHRAQMRARSEMLLGQAMTMDAMAMVAAGNITGASHPTHPYSIAVGTDEEGNKTWWSYRYADPLSTPLKIIVNTLDQYQHLLLRQAQEGREDMGELSRFWENDAIRPLSASMIAIAQTVKDARLLSGFATIVDDFIIQGGKQAFNDPSDEDKPIWSKKAFEIMGMAFPRQGSKIYELDDPTRYQSASTKQTLIKGSLPYYAAAEEYADPLLQALGIDLDIENYRAQLPKAYDVNGVPLFNPDPLATNMLFSATTEAEFNKGLNEDQIFVREKLYELGLSANTTFYHSYYKRAVFGNEDLRNIYTEANGEYPREPLFNRWMRYYREEAPESWLREVLEDGAFPVGIPSNSPKVTEITRLITQHKQIAWDRMSDEEPQIQDRQQDKEILDEDVVSGRYELIK